jgi:tetratricopeptide (TPR) repeat protein
MRFTAAILVFLFLFAGCAGRSRTVSVQANGPNSLAMRENDEFRRLRMDGFNALYNMDYKGAQSKFEKMAQIVPDHPAGHFYLATNYLFDQLNSRRRLQVGIYSNDSFYGESKEKIDEKTDLEFRRLINLALEKAQSAAKVNQNDPEALYYQGAAHGLLALYETTVVRSFFSALSNGRESVNLHRKVIAIDPNFNDAYLTIGTYDYIVGSLPFFVKLIAKVGGISGSRDRGLEELQTVIEKGRYASDDARVTLITLFSREKRFDEVLKQLNSLSQKYPRNYLFKLETANVLVKLNKAEESNHIFEQLLKDEAMKQASDLIHYQYGEALAGQKRHQEAIKQFQAVANLTGANAELVTRSRLRSGHMFDLLQRRSEAVNEYQAVLQRDNVFDSHEQARRYLKRPYFSQNEN